MRADLGMSTGKIAAQAGHAFLGAFLLCKDASALAEYHREFPRSPATKVCLAARNLAELLRVEEAAQRTGISTFRVVDSGCENFFGGRPTITALGFGPAAKAQIHRITKKLQLL